MCGISGIVARSNVSIENEIVAMNEAIRHRGPDGDGFHYGSNFAFGHRRLRILDLSENGKQPMSYTDGLVITFNGEIFNYLELKALLIQEGYQFTSKTDTEVILAAYKHWGTECVEHFNGMWSFALYDPLLNRLFCSRDRFGIKPFYYYASATHFAFGSELKQLLPFLKQRKCNRQVLLDYLISGLEEYSNDTFFEGIQKLEQGSNLIYDLNQHTFEIENYYSIHIENSLKNLNEEDSVALYKQKLSESVRLRMRSDVEVGTCLSGGLDSSSITALAAEIMYAEKSKNIQSIHAHTDDSRIDESKYAKIVADSCPVTLNLVKPDYESFKTALNSVILGQEEPFGSPSIILQYFVLKKAKEQNCIVMLDGQGGDESLLGYEKYYPAFLLHLKGWKKVKAFLQSSKNSKLSQKDLVAYYLYFTRYRIRLRRLKRKHNYLKSDVLQGYTSEILKELSSKYVDLTELQKLEITKTQLPHLLKYEDRNSMLHSIEARLPFLDYKCVETALSLPDKFKIKDGWTKYILRKAMDGKLPDDILWRKNKLGFNAPEEEWLGKMNTEMHSEVKRSELLNEIIDADKLEWSQLDLRTQWRLFNIARWENLYQVQW